jgi:hypothetical protein
MIATAKMLCRKAWPKKKSKSGKSARGEYKSTLLRFVFGFNARRNKVGIA